MLTFIIVVFCWFAKYFYGSMKYILHGEHFFVVKNATKILIRTSFPTFYYQEVTSANALVELLSMKKFDIVILGDFPRQSELILTIRKIRLIAPQARVLVLTSAPERLYGVHCMQAGAAGFVSKRSSVNQILKAIEQIFLGKKYISENLRNHLLEHSIRNNIPTNPLLEMSIREMMVIDMLCEGEWVKEIANKLDLKTSTISTYKGRVFQKLAVGNLLDMFCKVVELKKEEALQ